ncbi:putative benzoate transporter [Escherichia coli]|uniref:Putative benzoate transporter n=1 Tax=Escherichia coli TaxID=562 RepID=A0A3S5DW13_ECOLX|nr:putative benzoate transporter [Escherichia coli]
MKAAGYSAPVSPLIVFTGLLALVFSPFGVYSVGIAAITAAICQSPEAHPDKDQRWLAAAVAGIFYLLAGLFGSAITGMMAALPVSWNPDAGRSGAVEYHWRQFVSGAA